MSKDASGVNGYERAFKYTYDSQNRYTAANYAERSGTGAFSITNGWSETGITYDVGGNIKTLNRNSCTGSGGTVSTMDQLTYTYSTTTNPNQLNTVAEAGSTTQGFIGGGGTYTYDVNGNLTADPNKGISNIAYNYLNRTDKISFLVSANRYINYTYDANGAILRKQQYDNIAGTLTLMATTDYKDGFVYIGGTLSYFPMPEGRVLNNAGTMVDEYIIGDQQGNAKVSFQNNSGTAKVMQENSYYPTGLIMPNSPVATPTTPNKQLYNGGSEWQNDYANMPDYYQTFYRNYDAAIARFVGVDPQAESAESINPYNYAGNNPVIGNDPLGNVAKLVDQMAPVYHTFGPPPGESEADFEIWADATSLVATGYGGTGTAGYNVYAASDSAPSNTGSGNNGSTDAASSETANTPTPININISDAQLAQISNSASENVFFNAVNYDPPTSLQTTLEWLRELLNNDQEGEDKFFKSGPIGTMAPQILGACGFAALGYARQELSGGTSDYGDIVATYIKAVYPKEATDPGKWPKLVDQGIRPNENLDILADMFFTLGHFDSFRNSIDSGNPVITFLNENINEGHVVLIVGYEMHSTNLIYMDPEIGNTLSRGSESLFNTMYAAPLK